MDGPRTFSIDYTDVDSADTLDIAKEQSYAPTVIHSGDTIRHFRFFFRDKASHSGTEVADGGWNGP